VDTANLALAELQRRAAEIGMCVEVVHGDAAHAPVPTGPFDMALCMFALHYFCDSKQHVQALLQCASARLEQGGVLCGTFERHHDTGGWGVAHHAVVGDCVDALEWRVPWDEVVALAWKAGLALVRCEPFYVTDREADNSVYGFIFQQAQAQCCGRKRTYASTEGTRDRH
jgi:SAM-dependent methyltransferase